MPAVTLSVLETYSSRFITVAKQTHQLTGFFLDTDTYAAGGGIQSFLMGGGALVPMVAVETSPMIFSASLQAWYIRNISSLFRASSALSSIIFCYGKIVVKINFI